MPIYEYRCIQCGNVFARLQRVGASSKDIGCPKCDSPEVERMVSAFASTSSSASTFMSSGPPAGCGPST